MIKILFILPSLKAGGAERVISFVSQNLDKNVFDVTLLIQGHIKDKVFDTGTIKTVFLEKARLIKSIPDIFSYIKKAEPNIVVGSIGHVNLLLGLFSIFLPKIRFVGREASVGSVMNTFSAKKQLPFFVRKYLYNKLSAIICQSEDMKNDFDRLYRSKRSLVINNPITVSQQMNLIPTHQNGKLKFITVGRLSGEKGHERILRVLKEVKFDYEYLIVGSGPLKKEIENLIMEFGLSNKVSLLDHSFNVSELLLASNFFLQGSYVEGFPNALLEAISLGIPCIAFNAPGGTREIIKEGFNGFLANDEKEFRELLLRAIAVNWENVAIRQDINSKFGRKNIILQYESLFYKLVNDGSYEHP
ncbi:glycosyltransferase [Sphingobacterium sp. Lzh-3]|uniref:glycosyltransferase n=1 Tax=Sphingobacterium sp. Lzh-3 TaxID=3382150 RepID=UPI00398C97F1